VKFSDTPGEVASGAPLYGQHTREVLREHGFADDEIERLLAEGAIAER
jgi:crotonobetainyl-CoA:carnitine CoA-transferase CaiB-like acyl-CoA transferase